MRIDYSTAEQVVEDVCAQVGGVARATVYRVLEAFVAHGLLRTIGHPESVVRYDPRLDRHHHLICDRCGSVMDFEHAEFDALKIPETVSVGIQVHDLSVHLRGICAGCIPIPTK